MFDPSEHISPSSIKIVVLLCSDGRVFASEIGLSLADSSTCVSSLQLRLLPYEPCAEAANSLHNTQCPDRTVPGSCIWRCSGRSWLSTLKLISMTFTSSSSASFHCPWFQYVDARLAMLAKVDGCSWPDPSPRPSLRVPRPPSTVPGSCMSMRGWRCWLRWMGVSMTFASSSSASFHRPRFLYVDARLAMLVKVSGCSWSPTSVRSVVWFFKRTQPTPCHIRLIEEELLAGVRSAVFVVLASSRPARPFLYALDFAQMVAPLTSLFRISARVFWSHLISSLSMLSSFKIGLGVLSWCPLRPPVLVLLFLFYFLPPLCLASPSVSSLWTAPLSVPS